MVNRTISHSDCSAIALSLIFSRENLKGVKGRSEFWRMKTWGGAIAHGECFAIARRECFPNKLPRFFSREILRAVKKDYLP
ncbi:hypothetical protein [Cylindrospermopsis raciborskii]|uniref:hypothetical protein n=1 Tax=Cylindrospermopsis raciborskii TaxID=77022 RepID=UPI00128F94AF|nr:hypothetical protein [Cylindrospermopsis raciborskii]